MRERESSGDLLTGSKESSIREVVSPRVILLGPSGKFILVSYRETGWWGLPGGKVKVADNLIGGSLLSTESFQTLQREVSEEVGIDISPFLQNHSVCLGLTEVCSVYPEAPQIIHTISPIFICKVPDLSGVRQDTTSLASFPFPGPLFPDARIALKYFFGKMKGKTEGWIIPEFLNPKEAFYFQMEPTPRLLFGPPSWV